MIHWIIHEHAGQTVATLHPDNGPSHGASVPVAHPAPATSASHLLVRDDERTGVGGYLQHGLRR
jgi:hypothetical protein